MTPTVFISGGAGGIGAAVAFEFAKRGCNIALGCNRSDPSDIIKKIEVLTNIKAYRGDLSDYNTAKALISRAEDELGDITCLVNNAGVSHIGLFNTMQPEQWQSIIDANLSTMINCSHIVLQGMLARHSGSIVNVSSMWGEAGASCEVIYSMTKGGVDSFTRALAKETAPNGIRVNAVAPGVIDTRMNAHLTQEELSDLADEIPMSRFGTPEEVAKAVCFLADDSAASYITGEILRVNGGIL